MKQVSHGSYAKFEDCGITKLILSFDDKTEENIGYFVECLFRALGNIGNNLDMLPDAINFSRLGLSANFNDEVKFLSILH